MMLSRRHDEDVVYEQQQTAASKPQNQGIKGLAPKTPANKPPKTPFGKNKNDENITLNFAKGGAKEGKAERNAFVTPANNRPRPVLGNKTTNAKAFQTPAPLQVPEKDNGSERPSSNKPTSPRLRRSKIKVHASTSVDHDILSQEPEEREIEYMPPREVPLADIDEDIWPANRDLSVLEGKNLTRGWWSEYAPDRHKTEDDPELSDYEENIRQCEERQKREAEAKNAKAAPLASKVTNRIPLNVGPTAKRSQDAASALSNRSTKPVASRSTAPTAASKARQPITTVRKPIFDRGNPRFTAAKAASNSTIGYSKGRVVSAHRRPLADIHAKPAQSGDAPVKRSTLDDLLSLGGIDIADEGDDLGFSGSKGALDLLAQDDEEEELFQLDPVQDL